MIKTNDPMKRLVIDIETAPDMARIFGQKQPFIPINQFVEQTRMLSFAAKWVGEKKTDFYSEFHDGRDKMLDMAYALIDEADVLIHFNGDSFDRRHLNREMLLSGRGRPSPYQQIDLVKVARAQFWFTSYKLDNILHLLGDEGKVHHEGFDLWVKCLQGDPKAWRTMRKYNIGDVVKTEFVYQKFLSWIDGHPNFQLFVGKEGICPTCSGSNLQSRGYRYTQISKYQRFFCTDCESWSRGKSALFRAEER